MERERLERERLERERLKNETLENKINEMERIMNEQLERERSLENKINEIERTMNEKLERERLKNEILENKINEMERIILNLNKNNNNYEGDKKIININGKKNLNEKGKEKSNLIINENGKEKSNVIKEEIDVIINEKGDLAIVLYNHNGISSEKLTLYKNEYLIVTNWNDDDGYAFGYKRNDPQQKGRFPTPLVRKYSENNKGLFLFFFKL